MSGFWNLHHPLSATKRQLLGAAAVLLVVIVWAAVAQSGLISTNKLPPPWDVVKAFMYLSWHDGHSMLLAAVFASLQRIAIAGLIVVSIGIPVGVAMGASPIMNSMLSPLLDPFRSAPVVALLPIFVMWLGIGETMKVSFLVVGAVVYLIPMVRDAVVAVPYNYWESVRDLGATQWECISRAVVPMSMPRVADAIIVSVSIMWTYITVAEYVNADSGIGQLISNARRFSAMDQVFAGIITIIVLALATYQLMSWAKRKTYHWEVLQ